MRPGDHLPSRDGRRDAYEARAFFFLSIYLLTEIRKFGKIMIVIEVHKADALESKLAVRVV